MTDDTPPPFWPKRLAVWLDLLVKVGAIFAAVFAIVQYLQAREDARIEKTLRYVSEFRDAESAPGGAGKSVSETLWRNTGQIEQFEILSSSLPEDRRQDLRRDFIAKLVHGTEENPGLRSDIIEIASFFEALAICVDNDLCDRNTAVSYFGEYATVFWQNFDVYLKEQREVVPDFAGGVERFVNLAAERRQTSSGGP
ncbi:hypothetical protein ACFMPD_16710 [Sedimentitalea sp. HM32M-2]|uniref:DUF4760 domain-containing protein n=1 Tax=Sedimentitalea sp. HM32M-2 TaxID=3351566 RepID=UPI00363ABED5